MRRALVALTGAAFAASLALTAFAPAASAKIPLPTVTALHAVHRRSRLRRHTERGRHLRQEAERSRRRWAARRRSGRSTSPQQALADHVVSVNDFVTINADEASHKPPNESSMTDLNDKPLEKGEVVKFGDLIRGMMYPSGNNADLRDRRPPRARVLRAGQRLARLRRDDERLRRRRSARCIRTSRTPPGSTTMPTTRPRRSWPRSSSTVLQDPFVRAGRRLHRHLHRERRSARTGPKTYQWSRNSGPYVGWEGEKNGVTPNCSGAAKGCHRPGRDADRPPRRRRDDAGDGGARRRTRCSTTASRTIFHPDADGASGRGRRSTSRRSTASAPTAPSPRRCCRPGAVNLTLWTKSGASISKVQSAAVLSAAGGTDVAVKRLASGDIVVATARGGALTLARWTHRQRLAQAPRERHSRVDRRRRSAFSRSPTTCS